MKYFLLSLSWMFIFPLVQAQSPLGFSYQAVIRNAQNQLVSNTQVTIRISIVKGTADGKSVYAELHATGTNANGLVTLTIGNGNYISGDFAGINWADGPYFIKTETDPSGGTNFTISGTTQMLSVPYALHATTAEKLRGQNGQQGFKHYIGELFGGGIVFFVYKDSAGEEHGLVAALNDLGQLAWGNSTLVGTTAQSDWDGAVNTLAITKAYTNRATAASECKRYRGGNYDDWYLPAVDEMRLIMTYRYVFGMVLGNKNLMYENYWTSTEYNYEAAWDVSINYNVCNEVGTKGSGRGVRPVRRF